MSIPLRVLGISEKKQSAYRKKGFETAEDIIKYLPRRYDDLSNPKTIATIERKEFISIIGTILRSKDGDKYVNFTCQDIEGNLFSAIVYGPKKDTYRKYPIGRTVLFGGVCSIESPRGRWITMMNPKYIEYNIQESATIHAVYKKVHKDIKHEEFQTHLNACLAIADIEDYLERELYYKWNTTETEGLDFPLMLRTKAYRAIHKPQDYAEIDLSYYRIAFDQLFDLSFQLNLKTPRNNDVQPISLPKLDIARQFIKSLPFNLTDGQFTVLKDMMARVGTGKQLSALVQGDVGSGKTLVAIIMMLCHVENGLQSVLMAPTMVLAKQHALEIEKLLGSFGYKAVCLTGELKAKERKEVLKKIENGEAQFIVGTHAVLGEKVKYKNLGLFICDEEQRFGVRQREALKRRIQDQAINFISMTATPIPRTLANALYDDNIQTYSIKTLPAGRQPIVTNWISEPEQIVDHLIHEINNGRQGYLICPFVEKNEKIEGVMDTDSCETWVKNHPKLKHLRVIVATGQMEPNLMEANIRAFKDHEYDILISTTVIEVGVNVPNATLISIMSAERFGLAQLHQLRGRVGRGSHASYCYLVSEKPTEDGRKKLEAMVSSTDGFYLSEVDLKLRGAGDLLGDSQSGFENSFLLLLKYPKLFEKIQNEMRLIFQDENRLRHYSRFFKEE